ncbi:MAG: hypothetical protein HY868_04135 [Chloroflexi bacterium]|nr:hypothetical protein [Chloroflexota bacterium]
MNLTSIEEWLKGTIPGIIVLGIIASMIAYYLIQVLAKLFRQWLPSSWRTIYNYVYDKGYRQGAMMAFFGSSSDDRAILVYVVYHALVTLLAALSGILFFVIFLFAATTNSYPLTITSFLSVVVAIASLYIASIEFLYVQMTYHFLVEKTFEQDFGQQYREMKSTQVQDMSDTH